jgi:hypothetical protein
MMPRGFDPVLQRLAGTITRHVARIAHGQHRDIHGQEFQAFINWHGGVFPGLAPLFVTDQGAGWARALSARRLHRFSCLPGALQAAAAADGGRAAQVLRVAAERFASSSLKRSALF